MKHVVVGGKTIPVMTTEKMVGHQITAMHRRNVHQASHRGEVAAIRARKVSGLAMTRRQKTRLIQAAVIPAAAAGTLWDIPSKRALANLRSEVINAIWGRGRKLRSAEMVTAIINDPTKTDPLAAIVYKRLSDARRLMKKKKSRLQQAMRVFEMIRRRDVQHPKGNLATEGPCELETSWIRLRAKAKPPRQTPVNRGTRAATGLSSDKCKARLRE